MNVIQTSKKIHSRLEYQCTGKIGTSSTLFQNVVIHKLSLKDFYRRINNLLKEYDVWADLLDLFDDKSNPLFAVLLI